MTACPQSFRPGMSWYVLQAQGYSITKNIVFQENKSAILLEKNGKASSSKCKKHIKIWFYFVTDQINQRELTVEWYLTRDMIGDLMTEPTKGAMFKKFRDLIMGSTAFPPSWRLVWPGPRCPATGVCWGS